MKRIIIGLLICFSTATVLGATLDGFYVQGYLMDNDTPVNSETCRIWVGIIDDATGAIATENMYSNIKVQNGIFDLLINFPAMRNLDWSKPYRMRFAFSASGAGSLYSVLPEQKLVSMPYAFMAKRIYGGTVEASSLSAINTSTYPSGARMAYTGENTEEAVAAWIGTQAVGKLGVANKYISGTTNYYGAFAEGQDYGILADSTGNAVHAVSEATPTSLGAGLMISGGLPGRYGIGARIIGPLVISRILILGMPGPLGTTIYRETRTGATGVVTIPSGRNFLSVSNSLVKKGTTLIYLQSLSGPHRIWVKEMRDGGFTINRSGTTGETRVGYLIVN